MRPASKALDQDAFADRNRRNARGITTCAGALSFRDLTEIFVLA
jgi:hypothetical protein